MRSAAVELTQIAFSKLEINMQSNLYHNRAAQWLAYAAVFALLALMPVIYDNPFVLNQFARYTVLATLAVSVSLVWGFGGILSLGQGIAFGMAAYGMAMTMQMQFQDPLTNPVPSFMLSNRIETLPILWAPFANTTLGLCLAVAAPTAFFAAFGAMMFQARIAGVFIAIMTLAMLAAWNAMVTDMQAFTAGFNGISPPLPLEIFGTMIDPYSSTAYWICAGFLAALTMMAKLLMQSRFGTVVQAIRGDPERARFLGYNVAFYQTVLFSISGFIAALAGMCWVLVVQYVSPTAMALSLSLSAVVWAAVGGRLSLIGAVIGAFLVNSAQSYLGDALQSVWLIFLGTIFVVIVLFVPNGIIGLVESVLGRITNLKVSGHIPTYPSAKDRLK